MCSVLQDFNIPLNLSTTINSIIGKERVEAVETVAGRCVAEAYRGHEGNDCLRCAATVGRLDPRKRALTQSRNTARSDDGADLWWTKIWRPMYPESMRQAMSVTIYDLVDYVSKAGICRGKERRVVMLKA